ncbi:MAG: ParB/RepB/Spo0J family partition protein [Clostridia bacterium]|nr:ParB/RepB/Spo0J family partition protein [Clostridia bacterium]
MAVKKGGLGRGLDSLFNENSTEENGVLKLNINDIEPNREQPRKDFDDDAVSELADSIAQHGLIQPIVVTPLSNGRYSIVAGERRWRACRMAGLNEVPVIVKDASKQELMEIALIENLQREDLNPVEEAFGYRSLIDSFGLTQEQVAERMGKSRSAVTNALRLLNLNEDELDALRKGLITAGHARCLIGIEDADIRSKMLTAACNGASVRDLERMSQLAKKPVKAVKKEEKNKLYGEVELSLRSELHRKVKIVSTGKGRGKITIEFYSDKELCDFANKLTD